MQKTGPKGPEFYDKSCIIRKMIVILRCVFHSIKLRLRFRSIALGKEVDFLFLYTILNQHGD